MHNLFEDFLCALKISFVCGIMGVVFIMFAELWITFYQICAESWVQIEREPITNIIVFS